MALREKIKEDLLASLKSKDQMRSLTLRLLLAAFTNKEKEKGETNLSDEQLQDVVATEAKKRREATEAYEKGGRPELAAKEKAELEVLLLYLPQQLTEDQIRALAAHAVQKTGAAGQKDMGKVMGELTSQVKGKADGAAVARIVKEFLTYTEGG